MLTDGDSNPSEVQPSRGSAFGLLAALQSFGNLVASALVGVLYTIASPAVACATLTASAIALLIASGSRGFK